MAMRLTHNITEERAGGPAQVTRVVTKEQRRKNLEEHLLKNKPVHLGHQSKRNNKENTQPVHESCKTVTAKVVVKRSDLRPKSRRGEDALIESTESARNNNEKVGLSRTGANAKRNAISQTHHAKQKKEVSNGAKAQSSAAPSARPPGTYKGRVIQSKIQSFRKPASSTGDGDKPTALERRNVEERRPRAKSAAQVISTALPRRSKSAPETAVERSGTWRPNSRCPTGEMSGAALVRPKTSSLVQTGTNKPSAVTRREAGPNSRVKRPPGVDVKKKPATSSTISQYRVSVETAEERRAKLADWLASKGKTLKRPPIASAAPKATTVVSKTRAELKPMAESELHTPCETEDTESADINTTMELQHNADMDLPVDPEIRTERIVVNLCNAMEALVIPSRVEGVRDDEDGNYELDLKHMKEECAQEADDDDDDECGSTTRQPGEGSVVRYSVSTTPYLQSVRRQIQGDGVGSGRRCHSTIKDVKFLTPVRRSCRIQRRSTQVCAQMAQYDPCVASLAELAELDGDSNAYIYRRNPALKPSDMDK